MMFCIYFTIDKGSIARNVFSTLIYMIWTYEQIETVATLPFNILKLKNISINKIINKQ